MFNKVNKVMLCRQKIATFKDLQGGIKGASFIRLCHKGHTIYSHCQWLDLANAIRDALWVVFLLALKFCQIFGKLLIHSSQIGKFAAQQFNLTQQTQQTVTKGWCFGGVCTLVLLNGQTVVFNFLTQFQNSLARFIIFKQCRVCVCQRQ